MHHRAVPVCFVLFALSATGAPPANLQHQFTENVRPFVTKYCVGCHSGAMPAAALDLKVYDSMETVVRDYSRWDTVHDKLAAKAMPPKAMPQPPEDQRKKVIDWIQAVRTEEMRKHAGDPGVVLARRLSNSEYNYTIRDLTGVDLKPTKEFPVDPANPAGFDNSGESLTMSPALLNKYLQASREVADHMVLTPDGFDFAPWPMLVETDREKYAVQRIINFYKSQPTDYAEYFEAAWRYKHRAALGKPTATLASIAAESKVSPKYLPMIWQLLEEPAAQAKTEVGPVAKLQGMWHALPAPAGRNAGEPEALKAKTIEMRDFVVKIRKHTAMQFSAPVVRGLPGASQPLLNWKLKQYSLHRREFDPKDLRNDNDPPEVMPVIGRMPGLHQEAAPHWAAVSAKERFGDPDLVVPAAERKRYEASFAKLANVFPDTFYITERGRYFPDDSEDKGRLLSAGYHSVVGFYRDDLPLMQMILDEKGQKELDRLWLEFDFIAKATERTWVQYYFNQSGEVQGKGAEASSDRPVDHEVTDEPVVMKMKAAYLAKAAADPKNDPIAPEAIRDHFDSINATLRNLEKLHKEGEPKQLDALLRFAARAYRRPLTKAEGDDLLAYYRNLREKNSLSHEDALRISIVSVLMSPDFTYRIDLTDNSGSERSGSLVKQAAAVTTNGGVRPLSPYALASRLSYFLWASMPDQELLKHAAAGDLGRPEVMVAQARRMMKDDRARGFATEFTGNWLDFRRFENHNGVDRERFPAFTNELREAMFEEPIRFMENLLRKDGSILDLVFGNYTFVNPVLAKHYGMPEVKGGEDTWVRVDNAGEYQRGGLIPMAVFLTQNAPGLRTSPVKRGYWIVHRLLGETIPPPPPVVPELPHDESKMDLPVRDMLAKHRENPLCSACHQKFDSFGLSLEGYGMVGDARTKDLAGRPVDNKATFPGGVEAAGFEGVRNFIREHRQADFVDGFNRKLLAYALNRSLQLSDEATIAKMNTRLAAGGYKIGTLVETIVTSPQFVNRRAADAVPVAQPAPQPRAGSQRTPSTAVAQAKKGD